MADINNIAPAAGGIFGGLAAGLGGGLASAGVGLLANHIMSQQEQKNYEINQKRNYEMSQQAQRNAIPNAVAGLKAAGLNPAAAAAGGAFGAAQAPAAPLQNKAVGMPNFPLAESINQFTQAQKTAELLDAQRDNIQADTNLKNSQAGNTDVDTRLKQRQEQFNADYDATMVRNFKEQYPGKWSDYVKQNFNGDEGQALAAGTAGLVVGFSNYFDEIAKVSENLNKAKLQDIIAQHPEYQQAMAAFGARQSDKIVEDIAYLGALSRNLDYINDKLAADTTLSKEQVKNLAKQRQQIEQDIVESKERIDTFTSQKFRNYVGSTAMAIGATSDLVGTVLTKGGTTLLKEAGKLQTSTKSSVPSLYGANGKPLITIDNMYESMTRFPK